MSMDEHGNYGIGTELQCCDPVVDPISLLTTIGAIAALALFLRQAVIDNTIMGRKKRRKRNTFSTTVLNNALMSGTYQA
jgi:hypothetical protein